MSSWPSSITGSSDPVVGTSIDRARCVTRSSIASTTRSTDIPHRSASASIDGESDRSPVSSSTARITLR